MRGVTPSKQSKFNNSGTKPTYQQFRQNIRNLKYPVKPISPGDELKNKIETFQHKEIINHLKSTLNSFNTYRQVRGDGNCFFRAIAFQIITSQKTVTLTKCFPYLQKITLTICNEQSIPKNLRVFYDDKLLKKLLEDDWQTQYQKYLGKYNRNYKMALAMNLAHNPYLDFIIILYFRSICCNAFKQYSAEMKEFLEGNEEQLVKKYGEESEGVVLNLCSKFLKIKISVYEVRSSNVLKYEYLPKKQSKYQVALLYFENHYDIIEHNSQMEQFEYKYQAKQKEVQFFEEVNLQTINGVCIQCNDKTTIYEDMGLCDYCYKKSCQSLDSYKKDKFVRGDCNQCHFYSSYISQQFGLCQSCMRTQKYYVNNKYHCSNCRAPIYSYGKCAKCEQADKKPLKYPQSNLARCITCKHIQKVDSNLGMCSDCLKRYTNNQKNQELKKSSKKRVCLTCRQSFILPYQGQICMSCLENNKSQLKSLLNTNKQTKCKKCNKNIVGKEQKGLCEDCLQSNIRMSYTFCKKCGRNSRDYPHISSNICKICLDNQTKKCTKCYQQFQTLQSDGLCKKCKVKYEQSKLPKKKLLCGSCKLQLKQNQIQMKFCKHCQLLLKNSNFRKCIVCLKPILDNKNKNNYCSTQCSRKKQSRIQ